MLGDFNDIGKGGLYYLYVSMANFHQYMDSLQKEFLAAGFTSAQQIGRMSQSLHLPDGKQQGKKINIFAILSGAASIASGLPNKAVAGPFAALSGVFTIAAETAPDPYVRTDSIRLFLD